MKGEAHHKQWSQTEKKFLLQNMHLPTSKLSEALGRTDKAILQKISKLTPAGTRIKRKQAAKQATFHFSKDPLQDIINNKVASPIQVDATAVDKMFDMRPRNHEVVEAKTIVEDTVVEEKGIEELETPPEGFTIDLDTMDITINGKTQRISVRFKEC